MKYYDVITVAVPIGQAPALDNSHLGETYFAEDQIIHLRGFPFQVVSSPVRYVDIDGEPHVVLHVVRLRGGNR